MEEPNWIAEYHKINHKDNEEGLTEYQKSYLTRSKEAKVEHAKAIIGGTHKIKWPISRGI
tara:strand:+ start:11790 stop:11969 length:180 start_codon:yes stop_codon:yes gene_type:complete